MKHPHIIIIKYVTSFYIFENNYCFVIENSLLLQQLFEKKVKRDN